MTEISASETKSILQKLVHERRALEKGLEVIDKLATAEQATHEETARAEAQKKLADGFEAKVLEANQIILDAQGKAKAITDAADKEAKAAIQKANDDINALVGKKAEAEAGLAAIQLKTETASKEHAAFVSRINDIKAELQTWEDKKAAFKASL